MYLPHILPLVPWFLAFGIENTSKLYETNNHTITYNRQFTVFNKEVYNMVQQLTNFHNSPTHNSSVLNSLWWNHVKWLRVEYISLQSYKWKQWVLCNLLCCLLLTCTAISQGVFLAWIQKMMCKIMMFTNSFRVKL